MGIITDNCEIVPISSDGHWHAERGKGIGGSDLGAILGLSKYASPWSTWAQKRGLLTNRDAGEAAEWGHRLEPVIAQAYAERTGEAIVEWPSISLISKKYPHMRANLDRLRCDSPEFPPGEVTVWDSPEEPPGVYGILECKSGGIASHGTVHEWDNGQIPEVYMMQGVHYGLVTGIHDITYAGLLGGLGLQTRTLEWDDDLADNILQIESWFWALVESGEEPPVDGSEATKEAIDAQPRVQGKEVDGGDDLAKLWDEFDQAKKATKEAEKHQRELRGKILRLIRDAEIGLANGERLFTFQQTNPDPSFNVEAFRERHPDLYDKFLEQRPGWRVLMPAKRGK